LKIPLFDLRAAFEPVRDEVMRGFESVLSDMQLFLGSNVREFEREFAGYCEAAHGVGVSSGTDALVCALRACEVGAGDEVIVPSLTFFASVEAIVQIGATPVLVDVDEHRLTLDPLAVAAALTPATRAIMPVHLYGLAADMDPILELARAKNLRVIEDAAQAHGARYRGRRCGSMGDAACFSFYYTKNLGAVGEGGFVTTSDDEVESRLRLLRDHGHTTKYTHGIIGANYRLDELQAVVLRAKLRGLDAGNRRRNVLAQIYRSELDLSAVRHPLEPADCESAHHVYPIRVGERDALHEHLAAAGIGTGIHYKLGAHQQPALQAHPHRTGPMSATEAACRELLSLPIYPELTDEQVVAVARSVRAFFEG
jgi:dTDP-4-amino-4,6-dideoxygalactose transaminase